MQPRAHLAADLLWQLKSSDAETSSSQWPIQADGIACSILLCSENQLESRRGRIHVQVDNGRLLCEDD